MIFIYLLAFLAILWFLDEILTLKEVSKHGLLREKNPIARKFIEEGGHVFLYFKIITFAVFCAMAMLVYSISDTAAYLLITIAIVIYGFIDYRNLDVLKK